MNTTIRDNYVHPKVKKHPIKVTEGSSRSVDFGTTNLLNIPRSINQWRLEHAVSVSKSVNQFFNYYFLDLCGLDTDTVCEILLGSEEVEIPANVSVVVDCMRGFDRAVVNWGIDFRYIGKIV